MPRRTDRSVPVLLLTETAPDGHWIRWLDDELTAAGRSTSHLDVTGLDEPALQAALAPLPADEFDVVAHGTGALLWLHHTADPGTSPRPARVALVSPPSSGDVPAGLLPAPLDVDAVRAAADGTVLVGGTDDPSCPEGIAAAYGAPLKMATTVIDGGGHLDDTTGYGEWPAMLSWCNRDNLAFY